MSVRVDFGEATHIQHLGASSPEHGNDADNPPSQWDAVDASDMVDQIWSGGNTGASLDLVGEPGNKGFDIDPLKGHEWKENEKGQNPTAGDVDSNYLQNNSASFTGKHLRDDRRKFKVVVKPATENRPLTSHILPRTLKSNSFDMDQDKHRSLRLGQQRRDIFDWLFQTSSIKAPDKRMSRVRPKMQRLYMFVTTIINATCS